MDRILIVTRLSTTDADDMQALLELLMDTDDE